jgi:hypothetical protein
MVRHEWLAVIAFGCSATRMPGPMPDDDPLCGFVVAPDGNVADGSADAPVISGGHRITEWTPIDPDRHVWSAHFPSELRHVGAVTVDGVWLDVARTPNRDPADPEAHGNWLFVEQSPGPPLEFRLALNSRPYDRMGPAGF